MKNKKQFISLLLCCIFILATMAGCGGSSNEPAVNEDIQLPEWASQLSDEGVAALKQVISNGKLVLGTSADYAPFEFHTEIDGVDTIVGFDISIAQFMAEKMGVELEITDMSFDNLLISLSKGDFDIVLASMGATPERQKAVDFSNPYYIPTELIVMPADMADVFNTKEDLVGHTLAAQKGTVCADHAIEVVGEENVVQLVKVQDEMAELLNGKVDAVVCDDAVGMGYDAMYDELIAKDLGTLTDTIPTCVAIQKDNAGMVELMNLLLSMIEQDTLDQWLGDAQVQSGIGE